MRGYKSFEGNPHPGHLNQRIKIGYTDFRVNENGYQDPVDIVLFETWALATDAGNQTYRDADELNTDQIINFVIRYRKGIKNGMWILFRGTKYIVETIGEYGFRKTYLVLKAAYTEGIA